MDENVFRRLKISGWRQFQDVDIELHPRLTIITGANGAGKSTLLSFFTRHFGYNRNYLATVGRSGSRTPFLFGLFSFRGLLSRREKSEGTGAKIGELEYSNDARATLRLPPQATLHYGINIEGEQGVSGIHIDSHRPPNIYRHVDSFPATPPDASSIGGGLNSEYMSYFSSGQVSRGSLHHIKMALIQMSIFGHGNQTMEPKPALISAVQRI